MKAGLVAIVGRPNVGKSTLLNALLERKISIVSARPATTRIRILGILTAADAQIVFMDTPGFEDARTRLGSVMSGTVRSSLAECDTALLLIDARGWAPADRTLLGLLRAAGRPVVLGMNKIDLVRPREALLPLIDRSRALFPFADIVPLSAARGSNVADVRTALAASLPEGEPLFPPDAVTNLPEKYYLAELIREKVFAAMYEEVPQTVAVEVEEVSPGAADPEMRVVRAVIYVERENLKGMIIGREGNRLKRIGREARTDMEEYFGRRVFLDLSVRTAKGWRDRTDVFRRFGYGSF